MTQQHRDVLRKLAKTHLACHLDTPPATGVPEDLIPDTYRWFQYVYTNTSKEDLTRDEKVALIIASMILLDVHLITWTRDSLHEVRPEKKRQLSEYVGAKIAETCSAETLRILMYISRIMPSDIYLDNIMVKRLPELLEFTK